MVTFTDLERAALRCIFSETPDLSGALNRQLAVAVVSERINTGVGFFTTIAVPAEAPKVGRTSVLGYETQARVAGLRDGLGFVLFLQDGWLSALEGYVWGAETTTSLDLMQLGFTVVRRPIAKLG